MKKRRILVWIGLGLLIALNVALLAMWMRKRATGPEPAASLPAPSASPLSDDPRAAYLQALRSDREDRGEGWFRQQVQSRPQDAVRHALLAMVLASEDKQPEAAAAAKRALSLDAASSLARIAQGDVALHGGSLDDALRHYQDAARASDPVDRSLALHREAVVLLWKGRAADAQERATTERDVAKRAGNPVLEALALEDLAMAAAVGDRRDQACDLLEQACGLLPRDELAVEQAVRFMVAYGRPARARALVDAALARGLDSAFLQRHRIQLALESGHADQVRSAAPPFYRSRFLPSEAAAVWKALR